MKDKHISFEGKKSLFSFMCEFMKSFQIMKQLKSWLPFRKFCLKVMCLVKQNYKTVFLPQIINKNFEKSH